MQGCFASLVHLLFYAPEPYSLDYLSLTTSGKYNNRFLSPIQMVLIGSIYTTDEQTGCSVVQTYEIWYAENFYKNTADMFLDFSDMWQRAATITSTLKVGNNGKTWLQYANSGPNLKGT